MLPYVTGAVALHKDYKEYPSSDPNLKPSLIVNRIDGVSRDRQGA